MGNLRRKFSTEFKEEILSKVKAGEDSVYAIDRNLSRKSSPWENAF